MGTFPTEFQLNQFHRNNSTSCLLTRTGCVSKVPAHFFWQIRVKTVSHPSAPHYVKVWRVIRLLLLPRYIQLWYMALFNSFFSGWQKRPLAPVIYFFYLAYLLTLNSHPTFFLGSLTIDWQCYQISNELKSIIVASVRQARFNSIIKKCPSIHLYLVAKVFRDI